MQYMFIYSLKPKLKGFVKAQVEAMSDVSLNKVMTLALKLEEKCIVRILDAMTFPTLS